MKICIYEDNKHKQFHPLTCLRPVYLLRAGILPLFQRVYRYFTDVETLLACRDGLTPLVAARVRDMPVNIIKREESDIVFLNGRIRSFGNLPDLLGEEHVSTRYVHNGETVAVFFRSDMLQGLPPIVTQNEFVTLFQEQRSSIADTETSATLYQYPWELVDDIDREISEDYSILAQSMKSATGDVGEGVWLSGKERIFISDGVKIMPSAVLDAGRGPIYIGPNTRIEAHAAIYGPAYIGPNTVVVAGKIAGSSIGHTCRVGGEVEESVFHSYVNKYHAGFIGHSYVCPWVNLGAMTTNSDLKNNYSPVRVQYGQESVDTGSIKVGSFIGDHTKLGIGTLLNTGIRIGVCCNVFGGTLITDKEVPSFSWGRSGSWQGYRLDKAIETARRTCERRSVELASAEEEQLRALHDLAEHPQGLVDF